LPIFVFYFIPHLPSIVRCAGFRHIWWDVGFFFSFI